MLIGLVLIKMSVKEVLTQTNKSVGLPFPILRGIMMQLVLISRYVVVVFYILNLKL